MSASDTVAEKPTEPKQKSSGPRLSPGAKRGIRIGAIVVVVLGMILGTKVVSNDDPLAAGAVKFDPKTYGADNFPKVQSGIEERAVDATTLAAAITADGPAAAEQYAVKTSGGPVYSVKFTGVVGKGESGVYDVTVPGIPEGLTIRVQTGPAINGTELRDATGDITFGQFANQIEFQDAGSALNNELKAKVLDGLDTANLTGKTVTVTGAFTLVNPKAWLVTPAQMSVQ